MLLKNPPLVEILLLPESLPVTTSYSSNLSNAEATFFQGTDTDANNENHINPAMLVLIR